MGLFELLGLSCVIGQKGLRTVSWTVVLRMLHDTPRSCLPPLPRSPRSSRETSPSSSAQRPPRTQHYPRASISTQEPVEPRRVRRFNPLRTPAGAPSDNFPIEAIPIGLRYTFASESRNSDTSVSHTLPSRSARNFRFTRSIGNYSAVVPPAAAVVPAGSARGETQRPGSCAGLTAGRHDPLVVFTSSSSRSSIARPTFSSAVMRCNETPSSGRVNSRLLRVGNPFAAACSRWLINSRPVFTPVL